jgi:hypothetical protein
MAYGLHYTLRLNFLEMRTSEYRLTVSADFNLFLLTPRTLRSTSFARLPAGILKRSPEVGGELIHVRLRDED